MHAFSASKKKIVKKVHVIYYLPGSGSDKACTNYNVFKALLN